MSDANKARSVARNPSLLGHGPLQDPFEPGLINLPEIALDTVHQHHRDLLRITIAEVGPFIHPLFSPFKPQRGCDAAYGVPRGVAQVAVSFGDEDNSRFCHGLTVSPLEPDSVAQGNADRGDPVH